MPLGHLDRDLNVSLDISQVWSKAGLLDLSALSVPRAATRKIQNAFLNDGNLRTSFEAPPQGAPPQGAPPQGPPGAGGYHGAPPAHGGYPQGQPPPGAPGGAPGAGVANGGGTTLTFTTQMGKKVELSGESYDACLQSCRDSPELKDGNQSGAFGVADAALGGEKANQARCAEFCEAEFELFCFPGNSKVMARGRGAVCLSQLRVGDHVWAAIPDEDGTWQLRFDPVVAFLHRAPDMEAEVLQITHEQGKLELTAGHLLFAQKAGTEAFAPTVARDVRPGHRLAAPWVDGSVAKPEVLRIDTVRRKGLFAPLLACGTLLVDGTAASCYALPTPIADSMGFRRLVALVGWRNLQNLAQLCFSPVRMAYVAGAQKSDENMLAKCKLDTETSGVYHPYAWVLYVLGANLL